MGTSNNTKNRKIPEANLSKELPLDLATSKRNPRLIVIHHPRIKPQTAEIPSGNAPQSQPRQSVPCQRILPLSHVRNNLPAVCIRIGKKRQFREEEQGRKQRAFYPIFQARVVQLGRWPPLRQRRKAKLARVFTKGAVVKQKRGL